MRAATNTLVFLFFFASGFTWVAGETGVGFAGRVTFSDLVGVAIMVLAFARLKDAKFLMSRSYRAYVPFLLVCTIGVLASEFPQKGAFELLVHVFIFLVSLALYNLYAPSPNRETITLLLRFVLYSGAALAAIGLVDFFIFPDLLPSVYGGLSGTFRNSGQAGSFFGVYLAVLVPGFASRMLPATRINLLLTVLIVFALVFTFKRAAIIGFGVGMVLLSLSLIISSSRRDKFVAFGFLFLILIVAPVAWYSFGWGLENVEGMEWRLNAKYGEDAVETFSEGFFKENAAAAVTAFFDSPIFGVGLGNVAGVYTEKYEIHSTYLGILAQTGILGVLAYCFFMGGFLMRIRAPGVKSGFQLYLKYFLPLLVGLMVSWAYTIHLRKREFWIMFFIVALVIQAARRATLDRQKTTV